MSKVLEPVPFCSPRRERQNWIEPIQCLNCSLFIYAENRSMSRGLEVETDDIGRFAFKVRVVAGFVCAQALRLESSLRPHACHAHMSRAKLMGKFPSTPLSRAIGRFPVQRPVNDPRFKPLGVGAGLAAFMSRVQTSESSFSETISPQSHRIDATAQPTADLSDTRSLGQRQNDVRSLRFFRSDLTTPSNACEFSTFWRANHQSCFHTCEDITGVSEVNVTVH